MVSATSVGDDSDIGGLLIAMNAQIDFNYLAVAGEGTDSLSFTNFTVIPMSASWVSYSRLFTLLKTRNRTTKHRSFFAQPLLNMLNSLFKTLYITIQ